MLTPTLSTGIPTAELWANEFLMQDEIAQIEACYEGAVETSDQCTMFLNLDLKPLVERYLAFGKNSWNANNWFEALHDVAKPTVSGTGWLGNFSFLSNSISKK
jgi:hypothetical protein